MHFWLRLINYQSYHIWVFIKWTQFFIKSAKNGSFFYKYEYRGIMKNIHPWKGAAASSGESMLLLLLLVMLALLVEEIVKVRQDWRANMGRCGEGAVALLNQLWLLLYVNLTIIGAGNNGVKDLFLPLKIIFKENGSIIIPKTVLKSGLWRGQ